MISGADAFPRDLEAQLDGSCGLITDRVEAAAPYWTDRPLAGTSMPGFVLWHCARIMDWAVNTVIRTQHEVAFSDRWREPMRFDLGHGPGLAQADADAAALTVLPGTVSGYASELREQITTWIAAATEEELDRIVDMRTACAVHPRYLTDAAWEEVKNLDGVPAWQLLIRPCAGHIRAHIGELDTLLTMLRAEGAAG